MKKPTDEGELIRKLSEQTYEKLLPLVTALTDPICHEHGPKVATNVLTNAAVSLTAWQFGNQMGQFGKWDSDQERQDYCTKIGRKLLEMLETEKPRAS